MEKQDKKARLQAIRKIVSSNSLGSQEELLAALREEGFSSTQTTLSRDLKKMRISKVRVRSGLSVYALPREGQFEKVLSSEEIKQMKWRLDFSGNLMVVHTPPGHASMVAYDIDNAKQPLFRGTVAGDDTVIVVLAEDADRDAAGKIVRDLFPGIPEERYTLLKI
jgi:transcriptional regulator of arginine metabolism